MIKTLSDAITLVEFIVAKQGKSVENAIKEADVPMHLQEHVFKYFSPPLEITPPDIVIGGARQIPRCNPDNDSMQQYFGAYRRFLIDDEEPPLSKSAVETISETSAELVRLLPKPSAVSEFHIQGLVVGHIQSGKTANMAALIARAVDEGYKLFIILGGFWKDLRAQTQRRLDKGIVGESDDSSDAPFVQHDITVPRWGRLTNSGLEGDFVSGQHSDLNPLTPKLAVIKKNKRIENIRHWLERSLVPLKDLPAVIIDDEADQGSIDTNYGRVDDDGERIDSTATNKRIRDLLKLLPKCVYIGFTATPFANVLIDAEEDDLYPSDFIAVLPEPPGYFGPRRLFGIGMEPSNLSSVNEETPDLDVIRYVKDEDLDQIDLVLTSGGDCPSVLSDALLAFLLSCCARMARGHERSHFSMLVHPSQRTEPQRVFASVIDKELGLFREAATRPSKFPNVLQRAREMWSSDFRRVTKEQNDPDLHGYDFDFDKIWKYAKSITDSIEIKIRNSNSPDKLDYSGYPKRYIVVGGNVLSRGLTLYGLSVSVFTRTASQYDTLLQMGRWFGFRPQYYDLTRIYVDQEMSERFADLARVEDELRADLRKYAQQPNPPSPLELKPIIRSHPTMAITSKMKMGAGKPIHISFQNTIKQTVTFPVGNKELLRKNLEAARAFVTGLPKVWHSASDEGVHIWVDVSAALIIEFLHAYEFSREAYGMDRQNLVNYIKRQNNGGELILWDVVLPSGNPKLEPFTWTTNLLTRKIIRTPMTQQSIKVLSSPSDIRYWQEKTGRDLKDSSRGCIMLYPIDRRSGLENDKKFFSDPSSAEDIMGLVIIFPESKSHATIEYISQ